MFLLCREAVKIGNTVHLNNYSAILLIYLILKMMRWIYGVWIRKVKDHWYLGGLLTLRSVIQMGLFAAHIELARPCRQDVFVGHIIAEVCCSSQQFVEASHKEGSCSEQRWETNSSQTI